MKNENNEKPFHLTIANNETGEIIRELDFDALIGAAHISEEEAGGLFVSKCSRFDLAATVVAAEDTLRLIEQQDPMLRMTKLMVGSKIKEVKEVKDQNRKQ